MNIDESYPINNKNQSSKLNKIGRLLGNKIKSAVFGSGSSAASSISSGGSDSKQTQSKLTLTSLEPPASTKFFLDGKDNELNANENNSNGSEYKNYSRNKSESSEPKLIDFEQGNDVNSCNVSINELDNEHAIANADTKSAISIDELNSQTSDMPEMKKATKEGDQQFSTITNLFNTFVYSTTSLNLKSTYSPLLYQKQYSNRQQKLADINKFIISKSNTKFIFI
jgi:hypothetical protein